MSFDFEVDKFPSINMDTELDKLYNLEENNFNTYYTPPNELTDFISNSLSCLFVKDNLNSSEDQIANINVLYEYIVFQNVLHHKYKYLQESYGLRPELAV